MNMGPSVGDLVNKLLGRDPEQPPEGRPNGLVRPLSRAERAKLRRAVKERPRDERGRVDTDGDPTNNKR